MSPCSLIGLENFCHPHQMRRTYSLDLIIHINFEGFRQLLSTQFEFSLALYVIFFALIAYHNQAFIYKLALREKVDKRENLQGTDQLPLNLFYIKLKLCSICQKKSEKTDNYAQSCNCRNILFNYKVCQYRSNNVFCVSPPFLNQIGLENKMLLLHSLFWPV